MLHKGIFSWSYHLNIKSSWNKFLSIFKSTVDCEIGVSGDDFRNIRQRQGTGNSCWCYGQLIVNWKVLNDLTSWGEGVGKERGGGAANLVTHGRLSPSAAPGISWAQKIQTALNWMNSPSARLWFRALCAQGCPSDCRFSRHFCVQRSSAGLACCSCTRRKKIGKRTNQNWASLPSLSPLFCSFVSSTLPAVYFYNSREAAKNLSCYRCPGWARWFREEEPAWHWLCQSPGLEPRFMVNTLSS